MVARFSIDPKQLWHNPYPDLKAVQALAPAVEVPELNAVLICRRDDIFTHEKRVETFSSRQPHGLMTQLMGENMMRKDGQAHMAERQIMLQALNPRVVKENWKAQFTASTERILEQLAEQDRCDLVTDFAMPVCAEALKAITGLTDMPFAEMDRVSQHMLDGCANYIGDAQVVDKCHAATRYIDEHIDRMWPRLEESPDASVLSVQIAAGLPIESVRANVKLVISGGQNEPRDAIAGTLWALLAHPEQRDLITQGSATYQNAFEEYARWMSPIGMSPREIARPEHVLDYQFEVGQRVFFMFGAANRDPRVFSDPDLFVITRDTRKSISFGAGPHFCAGAAASRVLVAEVAIPALLDRFPRMRLAGDVPFGGWAFRGPLNVPVYL